MLRAVTPQRTALPNTTRHVMAGDPAVRAVAAIGLICVGVIHALEMQGQLNGAAWLTAGFAALTLVAPVAGLWLLVRPAPRVWAAGGLICLLAALGYILTRSVPVPGDTGDAGNWLEPLGLVALITEWIVVSLVAMTLTSAGSRRGPRLTRPLSASRD